MPDIVLSTGLNAESNSASKKEVMTPWPNTGIKHSILPETDERQAK